VATTWLTRASIRRPAEGTAANARSSIAEKGSSAVSESANSGSDFIEVNASIKGDPYRVEIHIEARFVVVYLNTQDKSRATALARKVANLHVPDGLKVGKRWWSNGGKGYGYCFYLTPQEVSA
jgi:hypothetical protein